VAAWVQQVAPPLLLVQRAPPLPRRPASWWAAIPAGKSSTTA